MTDLQRALRAATWKLTVARAAAVCAVLAASTPGWAADEGTESNAIAATWTDCIELKITFDAEKVRAAGLDLKEIREECRRHRFDQERPSLKIAGKTVVLENVARIEARRMESKPYTVPLPDGREVLVTPTVESVGRYLVPMWFFEENVREQLADIYVRDPAKTVVMSGIRVPGGQIPNYWDEKHIHYSCGENLELFARVELRGEKGPQAADIERAGRTRDRLKTAAALVVGLDREMVRSALGPEDVDLKDPVTTRCRLDSGFADLSVGKDGKSIYRVDLWATVAHEGKTPRDYGAEARVHVAADRMLTMEFLRKVGPILTGIRRAGFEQFVTDSRADFNWTAGEEESVLRGRVP